METCIYLISSIVCANYFDESDWSGGELDNLP